MQLTSADNAQLKYGEKERERETERQRERDTEREREREKGNEASSSVFRRIVECFVFVGVRFLPHWVL